VGAPHSSFLEALIIIMTGSSPVSRHENRHAFLISACQLFYQTIFVDRYSDIQLGMGMFGLFVANNQWLILLIQI
jgi:hypothetical protein